MVHKRCASNYTKSDQIKAFLKRQRDSQVDKYDDHVFLSPPPKLRSSVSEYDEKLNCLFCTEKIEFDQSKLAVERRRDFSDFQSLPEDIPKFQEKLKERDNQFIQEVKLRYDRITTICPVDLTIHQKVSIFNDAEIKNQRLNSHKKNVSK